MQAEGATDAGAVDHDLRAAFDFRARAPGFGRLLLPDPAERWRWVRLAWVAGGAAEWESASACAAADGRGAVDVPGGVCVGSRRDADGAAEDGGRAHAGDVTAACVSAGREAE